MDNLKKNKVVYVAMSGGVDSSVTAALLKKQSFQVVGIFMINWACGNNKEGCGSLHNFKDVQKVAKVLKIKVEKWNLRKEFKKLIFDKMIRDFQNGLTPNPDVWCNKYIKFGVMLDRVLKKGADFFATGHYARLIKDKDQFKLFTAKDTIKDQSYFLSFLNQKQFSQTIFPLGKLKKKEVRKLAKKFKLPVAEKKESQNICFVKEKHFNQFLSHYIKEKPGKIVTSAGQIIGEHQGLASYTIGQRQGIGIGGVGPFYVLKKNYDKNWLIVAGQENHPALFSEQLIAKNINWIVSTTPKLPLKCLVRYRHHQPLQPAKILEIYQENETKSDKILVKFKHKQRAVTPGQIVVFYQQHGLFKKKYQVLGGGEII